MARRAILASARGPGAASGHELIVPCSRLRSSRLVVLASEPLQGVAIAALLESEGLSVTYAESSARAARMLAVEPAIVVWVAETLDSASLEEALELQARHAELGFCFVANAGDPVLLRKLLEQDARRCAFVERSLNPGVVDLLDALSRVACGRGLLEGSVVRRLLRGGDGGPVALDDLSTAELAVLELLAEGYRNREIARRLWKTEKTVEKQVGHLFAKLGLDPSASHLDRRVAAARIFLTARGAASEEEARPHSM